jgi:hypothetical protein
MSRSKLPWSVLELGDIMSNNCRRDNVNLKSHMRYKEESNGNTEDSTRIASAGSFSRVFQATTEDRSGTRAEPCPHSRSNAVQR